MRRIRAWMPGACTSKSEREVKEIEEVVKPWESTGELFQKSSVTEDQKTQPATQSESKTYDEFVALLVAYACDFLNAQRELDRWCPCAIPSKEFSEAFEARNKCRFALEKFLTKETPKPLRLPAPQSESEAVRLLREAYDLMQPTDATHDWFVSMDAFLSRPAGPDWRKLAVSLAKKAKVTRAAGDWATNTRNIYAVFEMSANILDAIAAEKGG
jgi:hypothetical protein